VAPERIRAEWLKLISSPRAAKAIAWAGRAGVLAPAFRLDAAAASRVAKFAERFDAAPVRGLTPESRARVRMAIFCARIGLLPGEAASWLASRRFGRTESSEAALLLRLVEGARAARDERSLWRWVRDAGSLARDALVLLRVLSPRLASRARALALRVRRALRRAPRISGADVMKWSGVAAGPEVGRLLAELEIELLRGAVRSRREAQNWLSGQGPGGPWTAIIRAP
jgi:tRNA nucleotidyltransferase/poly(A) polymerase